MTSPFERSVAFMSIDYSPLLDKEQSLVGTYHTYTPLPWQVEVRSSRAHIRMVNASGSVGKTRLCCDTMMEGPAPSRCVYIVGNDSAREEVLRTTGLHGWIATVYATDRSEYLDNSLDVIYNIHAASVADTIIDEPSAAMNVIGYFSERLLLSMMGNLTRFLIVGRNLKQRGTWTRWLWSLLEQLNDPNIGQVWDVPHTAGIGERYANRTTIPYLK